MHYKLALIGFGGVNRALAEIIAKDPIAFEKEYGFTLSIVAVSDMFLGSIYSPDGVDPNALASLPVEQGIFATLPNGEAQASNKYLIKHSNADIIVEATVTDAVTGEPAISHCRWALSSGRHISTTNKGPLAFAMNELSALATENNVSFEYEGVVMSGTPVLRFADKLLKGNTIEQFAGIVNGTANYVLGQVEQGDSFDQAIASAQELGYAEANPEADIEGKDVMLKVMVLAKRLWGVDLSTSDVDCKGISDLSEAEVRDALANNEHWKLLGQAKRQPDGSVVATVAPMKLAASHPLAGISGPTNAMTYTTDMLGDVTVSGPGAGRLETAYAILSDIIAIHERQR